MIKGLSDKMRFPRLGKIRIGDKTEKGYPRGLDYFNCPDEVKKVYGEEPKELDIMFPVDDAEVIFPQYLKLYGSSSGLKCFGNGIEAKRRNKDTGEIEETECLYEECPEYEEKQCRRIASLTFMLPKVNGLGIYQIDTSSYNSILNLNSMIELIKTLNQGRIKMIPLKLVVEKQEVQAGGKKQKVPILRIRCEQFNMERALLNLQPEDKPQIETIPKPIDNKAEYKIGKEKADELFGKPEHGELLNKCAQARETIGDKKYYEILGAMGYETPEQIQEAQVLEQFLDKCREAYKGAAKTKS